MPRVMVVEDSPTQAQRIAIALEDGGFDVEFAPDAESGFQRLAETPDAFDAVLSDLNLPGDSGFDLCRRLKVHPVLHRVPIVVCTMSADPLNVLRGLQAGADGFMTKERDPHEIVGCVRRVINRPLPDAPAPPTPVVFLGQTFELAAHREQLLDVLVSAFEDVVHLNEENKASAVALRAVNSQLQQQNRELKRLADSERQAHVDLKQAESQLVQAEKLSSLGQLVAGIAHHINNPLAFATNNIAVLKRDAGQLRAVIQLYQQADGPLAVHQPELLEHIRALAEDIDLDYTLENLDRLMDRTGEGLKRIQTTVANLRDFARLDEGGCKLVNLNEGIVSTLNLVQDQAGQRRVTLETDLKPLPLVTCHPAKLNQVVLGLIVNALDACAPGDRVTIRTRPTPTGVEVQVADTGSGIAPDVLEKIFDPFFTTKPLGKGTGLGLSIGYGIIQSHGGKIDVESAPGQGARFTIHLPLEPPKDQPEPPNGR